MPLDVAGAIMKWLYEMSVNYGCFWVKWNCDVPREATESIDAFNKFKDAFRPADHKTTEELKALGRK